MREPAFEELAEFEKIEAVFHQVMSVAEAERTSVLAELTLGDESLLREVSSLVAAVLAADSVRSSDLGGNELAQEEMLSKEGESIGPYLLTRLLARGGMGEVYAARRLDEPTARLALKLIRRSVERPHLRTMFFQERDVLAGLHHRHIAALLDGSITDADSPYLVMELVGTEGEPGTAIDAFCVEQGLDLRRRVGLLRDACSAVSYAHRKLVAHGDLKPSNVLVDGRGELKLVDFGASRLLTMEGDGERPLAFTPSYASPEQMRGEPLTIASDVYSMGVLIRRVLGNDADVELRQLANKASSNDPANRYVSMEALEDDLRRWMENRPMKAVASGRVLRLKKWFRRNRVGVAVAAMVLVALCAAATASCVAAIAARRQAMQATQAAASVEELAHRLLADFQPRLTDLGSSTEVQKQLASTTLTYLNGLASEGHLAGARLHLDMVNAYVRMGNLLGNPYDENLGDPKGAMSALRTAVARGRDLVQAEPANEDAQFSLAMAQRGLAEVEFGAGDTKQSLADQLAAASTFDRLVQAPHVALKYLLEAASTAGSVGDVYSMAGAASIGDTQKAVEWLQHGVALEQRALSVDPSSVRARRGLALNEYKIGNQLLDTHPDQALATYQNARSELKLLPAEAAASAPVVRSDIVIEGHIGRAYLAMGRTADAVATTREVRDRSAAQVKRDPMDDRARYDLHEVQASYARALAANGDTAQAREAFQQSLATLAWLVQRQPDNPVYKQHCAKVEESLRQLNSTQQAGANKTKANLASLP